MICYKMKIEYSSHTFFDIPMNRIHRRRRWLWGRLHAAGASACNVGRIAHYLIQMMMMLIIAVVFVVVKLAFSNVNGGIGGNIDWWRRSNHLLSYSSP